MKEVHMTTRVGNTLRNRYATVAELKAAKGIKVGEQVFAEDRNAWFNTIAYEGGNLGYSRIDNDAENLTFVLIEYDGIQIKAYGAIGDGITDDFGPINEAKTRAIKIAFGSYTYRISNRIVFDSTANKANFVGNKATIKLESASAEYAFYIPTVGDGDLEITGASDVTWDGINFDGSLASSGVAGFEVWNASVTIRNCRSDNWGLSGGILKTTASGETQVLVENYKARNNTNHGIAVATLNEDASRIILDGLWCDTNGLGIDISTGSATVSNVHCWNNTNGGMKTAGNDQQHLKLSNCDFSDNPNAAAQGFYTNGTFRLLEFNNVRAHGNGNNGIQIAHSGTVLMSNISVEENGVNGLLQSGDAKTLISNINSKGNSGRGVIATAGDIFIDEMLTQENDRTGCNISTTGTAYIGVHKSIDDCLVSDNTTLFFQPASAVSANYMADTVIAVNTGASGTTIGVTFNANVSEASLGKVRTVGVAGAISDSGTNNSWADANGQTKLPFDRIGFYGELPKAKQSISGAKGGNAALTDLLTKLETLGLITDATS